MGDPEDPPHLHPGLAAGPPSALFIQPFLRRRHLVLVIVIFLLLFLHVLVFCEEFVLLKVKLLLHGSWGDEQRWEMKPLVFTSCGWRSFTCDGGAAAAARSWPLTAFEGHAGPGGHGGGRGGRAGSLALHSPLGVTTPVWQSTNRPMTDRKNEWCSSDACWPNVEVPQIILIRY